MNDVRDVIATSLAGDLRESDAGAARLRISSARTPPEWPLVSEGFAPSPLAESYVVAVTGAFEIVAAQQEPAWLRLIDGAQRLPVELAATGIVASLIRLAGSQLSRTSWIPDAIEAVAPRPVLAYDMTIPARPEMSEAASRGARLAPSEVITSEPETSLTPREREVLELVRLGLGNRQVAAQLDISPRTVEVHLSNIFKKLDVPSRSVLIARSTQLRA